MHRDLKTHHSVSVQQHDVSETRRHQAQNLNVKKQLHCREFYNILSCIHSELCSVQKTPEKSKSDMDIEQRFGCQ